MLKRAFSLMAATAAILLAGGLSQSEVYAQAETLPQGRGVVSFFYTRSDTETRFDFLGNRVRVIPPAGPDFQGFTKTDIFSIDAAYGITRRLEVHVALPLVRTQVASVGRDGRVIQDPSDLGPNDPRLSPRAAGVGNVRFGLRYNLISEPLFVTAKFDVKIPASASEIEKAFSGATLPIDEGQYDFDITGQVSKSFTVADRSLRVGGEAGVRLRRAQKAGAVDTFTNEVLPVSPGNEFIYNFQATYGIVRRLSAGVAGSGILQADFDVPFRFIRVGNNGDLKTVGNNGSLPPGFKPDFEKQTGRQIFSIGPIVNFSVTRKTIVTGSIQFAAAGRNYPAGQFYTIGVSRLF